MVNVVPAAGRLTMARVAGISRAEIMVKTALDGGMTIKQLYRHIAGARGHYQINGTPAEVADMMEHWVGEKGCDGFNIMPPLFPGSLVDFVDMVVPMLQRR